MILGLVRPSSGTIRIFGKAMPDDREAILARANFESPYVDLPRRLTVRQNLRVYAGLYGVTDPEARIAGIASDLNLEALLDRKVGELSAGQRTRVSLAKAVVNQPDLLLLDEPTASLDPDTGDWVRSYFERYRAQTGATILLASHNMAEVERLCDGVLMMKAGRLVDRGAPEDLIARYGREDLEQVFLDMARGRGRAKDDAPQFDGTAG
jgi:ABC-2 type transport system ATP-binding protein